MSPSTRSQSRRADDKEQCRTTSKRPRFANNELVDLEDLVQTARAMCTKSKDYRQKHSRCLHEFSSPEQIEIRRALLDWYRKNARQLPWRAPPATPLDTDKTVLGQRAYEVWVSEIMLQQTQVKTVIDYYRRWMERWPTVQALASASLEEVNEVWAGLGYYSRARRLHEAAQKLEVSYDGILPSNTAALERDIPGIGRYTAGAVASIAYGQPVPLVDGNVQRVLARLRAISGDMKAGATIELLWQLAASLVDEAWPGDLNQSLMELGATICTPVNPNCQACPVQQRCRAYAEVMAYQQLQTARLSGTALASSLIDTRDNEEEDACSICASAPQLEEFEVPDVQHYPRKSAKKAQRIETCAVFIVELVNVAAAAAGNGAQGKYLLVKRPEQGLLAGLWEFPSIELVEDGQAEQVADDELKQMLGSALQGDPALQEAVWIRQPLGSVLHLFTHIRKTYHVTYLRVTCPAISSTPDAVFQERPCRWVLPDDLSKLAVPTAMKKAHQLLVKHHSTTTKAARSTKRTKRSKTEAPTSGTLLGYFKPN